MDTTTSNNHKSKKHTIVKYTWWLLVGWTIIICGLLFRDLIILDKSTKNLAIREAQAHFQKDKAFRFWAATHGGFYVPIDERTLPNPYLSHVFERDIETPSGVKLTLMNPAYALRQIMEEFSETYGVAGHITSAKPLRPENTADEWETKALKSFETGNQQMLEFADWNNELALRLMQPLVTQKGCLKCHEHQGYSVGDIRGGVSVSVPMQPYLKEQRKASLTHIFSFLILWIIGFGGIIKGSNIIKKSIHKSDLAKLRLEESHLQLENRVQERTMKLSKSNKDLQAEIISRKQVEEALILSEQQYRAVYQNVPVGFQSLDADGLIIDCNPAWFNILGYQKEEVIGKWFGDFLLPGQQELFIQSFETFKKEKHIEEVQLDMLRKDGTIINVSYNGNSTYTSEGEFIKSFCTFKDISDEVEAKRALIKAKEQAEESDRLKSAFLANMSHEIRTPMNGILGFADLLKEPDLTGEKQKKYVGIIEKSGERMLNIINDLIDISKIEAGQMEVVLSETNIREQCEYLFTFFKPEAEGKGMQLSFNKNLPASEIILKTDREKVYAVLINLIKNAVKYSEKGTIEFGYKLRKDTGPVGVEFYVKDTGIGIAKDRQKAVFERFIQADIADKNAYQGAGLGLSISKAYVEMLGGEIWVESELGKGSTFYFTLPYQSDNTKEDHLIKEVLPSAEAVPIDKLKILIVDDDETSEDLLSIAVEKIGSEIMNARSGIDAVTACRDNPDIDLVLMDVAMPGMNGYEATRQIRKFNKDVVIIAQTAFALQGDKEKAIAAGCNDYIAKPIKKDELLEMIERFF